MFQKPFCGKELVSALQPEKAKEVGFWDFGRRKGQLLLRDPLFVSDIVLTDSSCNSTELVNGSRKLQDCEAPCT